MISMTILTEYWIQQILLLDSSSTCYSKRDVLRASWMTFVWTLFLLIMIAMIRMICLVGVTPNQFVSKKWNGLTLEDDEEEKEEGDLGLHPTENSLQGEAKKGIGVDEIQRCANELQAALPHPSMYQVAGVSHTCIDFYDKNKTVLVRLEFSTDNEVVLVRAYDVKDCDTIDLSSCKVIIAAQSVDDISWVNEEGSTLVQIQCATNILSIEFDNVVSVSNFTHVLDQMKRNGTEIMKLYNLLVSCSRVLNCSYLPRYSEESVKLINGKDLGGISMDTLRRCGIREIPFVSRGLESIETSLSNDDTMHKNANPLILGPVDFVNIFLPMMSRQSFKTKIFDLTNSMMTIVDQVSRYVNSFAKAMEVVKYGWNLENSPLSESASISLKPLKSLKRRQSFDTDQRNIEHDIPAKNEFYESIIGFDTIVNVHSKEHLTQKGSSQQSLGQAFTLVDAYAFEYPSFQHAERHEHPFLPENDPVKAISSLQNIVQQFPSHEFFVTGTFGETHTTGFIALFVRSLPKGVDETFDRVWKTYRTGSKEVKDRKLELFINLGPGPGLSFLAWAALKTMNTVLSWKRNGEPDIPLSSSGDRTPFPGMTMSSYTQLKHFSGPNWNSHTCYLNADNMSNWAAKVLFQRLEDGAVKNSIIDFSYVLEGEVNEELPERVLCTFRSVHIDFIDTRIPFQYTSKETSITNFEPELPLRKTKHSIDDIFNKFSIENGDPHSLDLRTVITDLQFAKPSALCNLNLDDIRRYLIATNYSTKVASARILESAQWRKQTFPVDLSLCKEEFNANQFFQHGFDHNGCPVFYFLNMIPGIWSKNIDNTVNALLHRLETSLEKLPSCTKVTIVVLLGMPVDNMINEYHVHTNYALVCRLYDILSTHYPERMGKCLLITDSSWSKILATSGLFAYVPNAVIRSKIVVLDSVEDLKKYIPMHDIAPLVGGPDLNDKEKEE